MTHQHNLNEFTPWKVESYELHETYQHGEPQENGDQRAVAVKQYPRGPDAIVLERALFLNGYSKLVMTPEDDNDLNAPRADDGRTWLDIPQVSLFDTVITLPGGERARNSEYWPVQAERIEIETIWNLNGKTSRKVLPSDLAFGRTDISDPRFAYPFVTPDCGLRTHTLDLENLILVAYSRDDHYEPDAEELARHRATASAVTDIALNGLDRWLTAVNQLVEQRLFSYLPAKVRPTDGIRVLLYDETALPIKTERYNRRDPLRRAIETDPRTARERANRLRYEAGPFKGHRGILLGTPATPHSKVWQKLVEMYDEGQGRRVWEPESPIQGRVIALDLALTDMAVDQGIKGALYGVVWTCEARRLPKRTQASRMATTGADPDQPDPHHRPRADRSRGGRPPKADARTAPAGRGRPRS